MLRKFYIEGQLLIHIGETWPDQGGESIRNAGVPYWEGQRNNNSIVVSEFTSMLSTHVLAVFMLGITFNILKILSKNQFAFCISYFLYADKIH